MSVYHNAVSDLLIVTVDSHRQIYSIYAKDNQLKHQMVGVDHTLPASLSAAIFSSTHVHVMNSPFTLCPLETKELAPFFELNHGKPSHLASSKTDAFQIGYDQPAWIQPLLKSLVNAKLNTDIELLYEYAAKANVVHAIYFYEYEGILTLLAWKNGSFVLANRYPIQHIDELFYFLMLVVEQLELPVDSLQLTAISSPSNSEKYLHTFKNYLPAIRTITPTDSSSGDIDESMHAVLHFFAQCEL